MAPAIHPIVSGGEALVADRGAEPDLVHRRRRLLEVCEAGQTAGAASSRCEADDGRHPNHRVDRPERHPQPRPNLPAEHLDPTAAEHPGPAAAPCAEFGALQFQDMHDGDVKSMSIADGVLSLGQRGIWNLSTTVDPTTCEVRQC